MKGGASQSQRQSIRSSCIHHCRSAFTAPSTTAPKHKRMSELRSLLIEVLKSSSLAVTLRKRARVAAFPNGQRSSSSSSSALTFEERIHSGARPKNGHAVNWCTCCSHTYVTDSIDNNRNHECVHRCLTLSSQKCLDHPRPIRPFPGPLLRVIIP